MTTTATMIAPVVGVFAHRVQAERAIDDLIRAGFSLDQLGVIVRSGDAAGDRPVVQADVAPEEGAAAGAVTGGVLGGLAGISVALTLPAVGPALALGILAGALGGATLGIAGGGLIGGLIGLGLSHEEASFYEQEFVSGRTLVTVRADRRRDEAVAILTRHGALTRTAAQEKG